MQLPKFIRAKIGSGRKVLYFTEMARSEKVLKVSLSFQTMTAEIMLLSTV